LLAFNNEILVREVVNFPVPVIAAIGHDKDVPLVSLAADLEVSTPSIAATTISESWKEAILFLEKYEDQIVNRYKSNLENVYDLIDQITEKIREYSDSIIEKYKGIEEKLKISLQNFRNNLLNTKNNLNTFWQNSLVGFRGLLSKINQHLENAENIISANNPERQLKKGYSIARFNGKIIKSIKDVILGKNIDLLVADGKIISQVKNINKINKNN